jgi:hypothetical protein
MRRILVFCALVSVIGAWALPAGQASSTREQAAAEPAASAPVLPAAQVFGSCDEPIPYDIFSGAATAGSTVSISSPYGSGSATADANGHWEHKVEFPTAPRGEQFTVTAAGLGASTTLPFIATGNASHS